MNPTDSTTELSREYYCSMAIFSWLRWFQLCQIFSMRLYRLLKSIS